MSSKFEPAIWSYDTGYIGIYWRGRHTYGCTVTKTRFSRTDGCHIFFIPMVLLVCAFVAARISAINILLYNYTFLYHEYFISFSLYSKIHVIKQIYFNEYVINSR